MQMVADGEADAQAVSDFLSGDYARTHSTWFHFTLNPRYFSAVDEIREEHVQSRVPDGAIFGGKRAGNTPRTSLGNTYDERNPLGKLPGSVWTVPTEPLRVPDHLGVDHFAAFPTEWPKRIISGWSPAGVCVACDGPLVPVIVKEGGRPVARAHRHLPGYSDPAGEGMRDQSYRIEGYSCSCPPASPTSIASATTTASSTPSTTAPDAVAAGGSRSPIRDATVPTRPAVVLDPFGGTGTTAMVAKALGRHGISVDMSADYCRLAEWRTNDPAQLAKARGLPKPEPVSPDQLDFLAAL